MIDLTGAMDLASGLMREAQKQLAERGAEIERLRGALTELASALDDGLCNSSCPDFDADRLDRALTAAQQVLSETRVPEREA